MTKDEALKLALEALMYASYEDIEYDEACAAKVLAARDAIKEALAQPVQEPFGYFKAEPFGWTDCAETEESAKALYEFPPKSEWVGLTDDEVYKIAFALEGEHWRKIADAIADKLKEKNA